MKRHEATALAKLYANDFKVRISCVMYNKADKDFEYVFGEEAVALCIYSRPQQVIKVYDPMWRQVNKIWRTHKRKYNFTEAEKLYLESIRLKHHEEADT